ncbi:SusC/RagA family TonB-linked outer membrane protein [Pedobacter arcticus]|uniref:SusC/RagA family TonB-linked outer membrane protein n=1 Tax=Pedobacter arcticus TaxID=752140 RepID=UPI000301B3DD|nr:TonB-dependent receptor [Pedobacter arcticus]
MYKKKKWCKLLRSLAIANSLILLVSVASFAQAKKAVNGRVFDAKSNETLPGVSVKVKTGNSTTITDGNGNFSIQAKTTDVLVFTSIGYESQEVKVGSQGILTVNLESSARSLQEVVVVGYGTVKKEDLTGSVGIVRVEQLEQAPVMSFEQALAGRIAGVQVSASGGQPGDEGISVVIRGAGSLTQDVSPLYVVDGFANENFDPSTLNTNDIESINILKDASAIAIYGARASNGVVVVETKKGKVGQPVVSYNGSFGTQEIVERLEVMQPYEFVKYQIEKGRGAPYLTDGRTLDDYIGKKGVDWQDQVLRTGKSYINNLAIRGGAGGTRYSISGSLYNNDAILINTGQDRYQGRVSLSQEVNKKISTGINLNYSQRSNYGSQAAVAGGSSSAVSSYLLYAVLGYRPVTGRFDYTEDDLLDEIVDEDIDLNNDYRVNPVLDIKNEYNKRSWGNLVTNAYVDYKLNKQWTFKTTGSINNLNSDREYFYNSETRRGNERYPGNVRGQWGGKSYSERFTWSNENTLTYKNTFNKKHNVDGLLGFSNQHSKTTSGGFIGINSPDETKGIDGLGAGEAYTIDGGASEYALQSFFGRANYNYKSKYFLTATMRADGSSRFAPGHKWGYFPSGAFAWRMSKESFMKDIKAIYDAKLRISYGFTGNNRVSDYAYIDLLEFSQSQASYSWGNNSPTLGAYNSKLGNRFLKWETTEQFDIGYDLALFKNKLELVVDYYTRTTHDLLLNSNMPYHTGYDRVYKNIGELRNNGVEVTLNTVNFDNKKFKWESSFNIAFNNNKILSLADGENIWLQNVSWNNAYINTPLYIAEVGQPAGQMFGYVWEGNYQYSDFEDDGSGVYTTLKPGVPFNNPDGKAVEPGDIKYRDLNGDGFVDDKDRTIIGRGTPIHSGGLYNSFAYKGFKLGVLLQWTYGNDIVNANKIMFEGTTANNLNQFQSYANRWSPENQTNENYRTNGQGPTARYSTKYIEDGSFLRLKTIELGYYVTKKFLSKYKISSLGLTASAQNLAVWSNYSGYDPEVSTRSGVLTPGFDFSAYPHSRTVVLGLRVVL